MPHAAAMACHGGFGTVRAGLAAGVPLAVLPLFADQPYNARRVAELGAGVALDDVAGLGAGRRGAARRSRLPRRRRGGRRRRARAAARRRGGRERFEHLPSRMVATQ